MKKLGFGFMRLPMKDESNIDYETLNKMVDTFMERGFSYFDTAYVYTNGMSEIAIREAVIKRYPREKVQIATKLPTFMLKSEEEQAKVFDEQLEKCGVDYFDYYLLHALGEINYKNAKALKSFEFAMQKKAEGKIKKLGFSFHDNADLLDEILTAYPEIEFVQLQINYLDWESESIQSKKCYDVVRKHNKPIIVMEPVKGGMLANVPAVVKELFAKEKPEASPASWAMRFAASQEGVEVVLSGMSNMAQLLDNTGFMNELEPVSQTELKIIEKAVKILNKAIAVPCTACEYCVDGCPKNIPIPNYFTLYNNEKQYPRTEFSLQQVYYSNYIQKFGKASDCIGCGECERQCPQHIEIIDYLKDVAQTFENN